MIKDICWAERCETLRREIRKYDKDKRCYKYLLADVRETQQASDMHAESPVLGNWFRMRSDIKTSNRHLLKSEDYINKTAEIGDMCFNAAFKMGRKPEYFNKSFVLQVAACNYHCPACYVDDRSRQPGKVDPVGWFTAREIVDYFLDYKEKNNMNRIRISGGEPGLVPELWLEVLEFLQEKELSDQIFVDIDTNLSTHQLTDLLMSDVSGRELDRLIWPKIARFNNYAIFASMKGSSPAEMVKAIGLSMDEVYLFGHQWRMLELMVDAGLDVYLNIYHTTPVNVLSMYERGEKIFGENFWFRTWVQPIKIYEVVKNRLPWIDTAAWQRRLDDEYGVCEKKIDDYMQARFGKKYRQVPRHAADWK